MMEHLWRMVQKVNGYGDGVGSRNKEGKDKGGKGLGYKGMLCTHFPLHLFTFILFAKF
jgi:hypothetical protein